MRDGLPGLDIATSRRGRPNHGWSARRPVSSKRLIRRSIVETLNSLENVFVKHYAPNHMPDPKGEWSIKESNSELHYRNIQKLIS